MRHLGSLIAGIVVVPVAWLLIAFGQVGSAKAFANVAKTGTYHTNDFIRPLIFLAVAGIVVGLIASLRISPVGPVVAGVAYVGSYVALLIAPKTTFDALNYNIKILGQTADLTLPLTTGAALLFGGALLVAAASVARWRRWPRPAAELGAGTDVGTGTEDTLAGGYDSSFGGGSSWTGLSGSGLSGSGLSGSGLSGSGDLSSTESTADLPSRKAVWPSLRSSDETTESVPGKGRSPWDTPLRDGTADV